MYCLDEEKMVLRLQGAVGELLNGITANELRAAQNVFLDRAGRIVALFDAFWSDDCDVIMVIQRAAEAPLREHLDPYCMLSGIELNDDDRHVYFTDQPPAGESIIIPQPQGCIVLTDRDYESTLSATEFRSQRLARRWPLQGVDFGNEMLLNVFPNTEYVSYDKGCFLGQEIIARVHYKSKPPKRLEVVAVEETEVDKRTEMTSCAPLPDDSREHGFLFVDNK